MDAVTSGCRASASASGVDREPGDTARVLDAAGDELVHEAPRRTRADDRPVPSSHRTREHQPERVAGARAPRAVAAVPISTAISSRPFAVPTASIGRIAGDPRGERDQGPLGGADRLVRDEGDHPERDGGEGRRPRRRGTAAVSVGRRAAPRAFACPPLRIGRDVAQVVRHQDRDREQPQRRPRPTTPRRAPSRPSRTRVPQVAISPKNTNTITSPRPSPAYGRGPPL